MLYDLWHSKQHQKCNNINLNIKHIFKYAYLTRFERQKHLKGHQCAKKTFSKTALF